MAGVQQGEKLLFEKFWRGTFKAVASPRPESIIVASITACRRPPRNPEPSICQADKAEEKNARPVVEAREKNGCIKAREDKHRGHRQARSVSFHNDLSPRPTSKGKKKRKKSQRKRRRRRSPSYSLSPVRKKKKKKSSKKRRRHRSAYKKTRHSSSSPKSKRKDDKKHKKRSRSHSHRTRRCLQRSHSESSACRSSSTDGRCLRRSAQHSQSGSPARQPRCRRKDHVFAQQTEHKPRSPATQACNAPPKYRLVSADSTIVHSGSGVGVFTQKGISHDVLSSPNKGQQDYDSGNDTSSPPSTKIGLSGSKVNEEKQDLCQVGSRSPEKSSVTDADNSDSGHSVTSYSSSCKPLDGGTTTTLINGRSRSALTSAVFGGACGRPKASGVTRGHSVTPHRRSRTQSRSRSRSRSRSSQTSRFSGRYSHSRSLSSERRSYSHTPSSSGRSRQSSVESGSSCRSPSYSRYSPGRARESVREYKRYSPSKKELKRERRRKRSYSPMRKRRRDSPSHLEARRITSARKRPIPYYRPSPSSSSPSTSYSSWSSIFTRSRSCSTYRSYSRSPSWSSLSIRSSRSRSYDSVGSYGRARR